MEVSGMSEIDEEFLPLPYYPYDVRPPGIPVDIEEAATALYLHGGLVGEAASRLKIPELKLQRIIDRSPRLTRLHKELVALLNDKVLKQVKLAFDEPEARRREWASAQVIRSEAFRSHPLAPSKDASQPTLAIAGPTRVIISWDDGTEPQAKTIEHQE
jgi:hypothetical protein